MVLASPVGAKRDEPPQWRRPTRKFQKKFLLDDGCKAPATYEEMGTRHKVGYLKKKKKVHRKARSRLISAADRSTCTESLSWGGGS